MSASALSAPAAYQMGRQEPLPPIITQPVQPVTPQYNNPGPQIPLSRPGNPVEQLAPMDGIQPPPSSLGIR